MGGHQSRSSAPLPPPPYPPPQMSPKPKKTVEEEAEKSPGSQRKIDEDAEHRESVEKLKQLPHRYGDIVRQADVPSMGDLEEARSSGIFLNQRRKKYWVDQKTGCNCFMMYARDLSITWSEDPRYWKWFALQETSDISIEVAGVINVCWLEIHGRFEMSYLSPGTTYEVVFVVMMSHTSYGWNAPVNLRLTDPKGNVQKHQESLMDKPRGEWIELTVGELETTAASAGEVEISLFEYDDGAWKNGLVVKGICIRPRSSWTRLIQL